ncbi:MAG: hypothetical protein HON23_05250 [Rickettsiales bacterium]|jgi:hypothetical protein|nr:hypothetical protein [Rickettsiales bacterium]
MDPDRLSSGPSPELRTGSTPDPVGEFSEAEKQRSEQAELAKDPSASLS